MSTPEDYPVAVLSCIERTNDLGAMQQAGLVSAVAGFALAKYGADHELAAEAVILGSVTTVVGSVAFMGSTLCRLANWLNREPR